MFKYKCDQTVNNLTCRLSREGRCPCQGDCLAIYNSEKRQMTKRMRFELHGSGTG